MPNPTGHIDSIKRTQFSSPWRSGTTRTIRVPIVLADATLEYARQLDKGIEPRDTAYTANSEVILYTDSIPDTSGSTGIRELPDAGTLLNRLKAKKKKVTASIADIEALLEILGDF